MRSELKCDYEDSIESLQSDIGPNPRSAKPRRGRCLYANNSRILFVYREREKTSYRYASAS